MREIVWVGMIVGFLVVTLILTVRDGFRERILGVSTGLADSVWPMYHGGPKHGGQSDIDTSHVDGTVKWKFDTGGGMD